jgi:hypothetical protein
LSIFQTINFSRLTFLKSFDYVYFTWKTKKLEGFEQFLLVLLKLSEEAVVDSARESCKPLFELAVEPSAGLPRGTG